MLWGDHGAHIKINLPIFKGEDTKDTVTYQSWRWDLTVHHHAGCRDCTLLLYAIWSLQGYPRELVPSSGTDITLDNVLTILDKHYNNIKALDALNQEFNYSYSPTTDGADKETMYQIGAFAHQDISKFWLLPFPICFPPTVWLN